MTEELLCQLDLNSIELSAIHKGLELLRKNNHTFLTDDELAILSEDIRRASNSDLDPTILSGRMRWKQ